MHIATFDEWLENAAYNKDCKIENLDVDKERETYQYMLKILGISTVEEDEKQNKKTAKKILHGIKKQFKEEVEKSNKEK